MKETPQLELVRYAVANGWKAHPKIFLTVYKDETNIALNASGVPRFVAWMDSRKQVSGTGDTPQEALENLADALVKDTIQNYGKD